MKESPGVLIRAYIEEQCPQAGRKVGEGEDLFGSGVLDSIGFTRLLIFLREKFSLTFKPSELTLENFATIAAISRRVEEKLAHPGAG